MHLDAERATHVFRHHANLSLGNAQMLGENVLHHVRCLRRLIGGQSVFRRVVIGHNRAAFEAHTRVSSEVKRFLDHHVSARERSIDAARIQLTVEAQVVA